MTSKYDQYIQKLQDELNGRKVASKITNFESVISENIESLYKNEKLYQLPLQNLNSILSKVDISSLDNPFDVIKYFIEKTIEKNAGNRETLFLMESIKCKDYEFETSDCINLLALFKQCEICTKLSEKYNQDNQHVEVDWEYRLKEKEDEIGRLKTAALLGGTGLSSDNDRNADIFLAVKQNRIPLVRFLIQDVKIDKNVKDFYHNTPLHIACGCGYLQMAQYLIEVAGADKEAKTTLGETPLHLACQFGHLDVVKYLVEKQHVDKNSKNNNGETPLGLSSGDVSSYMKGMRAV